MEKLLFFYWELEFSIKRFMRKAKGLVWNRCLKLFWHELWIRKNEFHSSLRTDTDAMSVMSHEARDSYIKGLVMRRNAAHKRDEGRAE